MQLSPCRGAAAAQAHQCSRASLSVCHVPRPGLQQRPSSSRGAPASPAAAVAPSAAAQQQQQPTPRPARMLVCRALPEAAKQEQEQVPVTLPRAGFFISKTEVPAFIPRDDMMDQLLRWALIEAEEGGQRNFGLPMKVHQRFRDGQLWGMDVEVIKEGVRVCDLSVGFDGELTHKAEWIGQDANGFPTKEGKQEEVAGKHFEIWKTCDRPVDDDLRAAIRAFCTGLVSALNKYYAFGSVFAEEV